MVRARSPPASQLVVMPSSMTEKTDSTMPKARASFEDTRPAATGRPRVRRIRASVSPSSAIFSAPAAPAPTAMHSTEMAASPRFIAPGAATSPVTAVNTTSDMTRGFSSWKKSSGRAVETAGVGVSVMMEKGPLLRFGKSGPPVLLIPRSVMIVLDHRQFVELVVRRRRGQGPLQGRGPFAPRIGLGLAAADGGLEQHDQEDDHADGGDHVAPGRDLVPQGVGFRIVDVAARHALQPQEVLREEHDVHAHEHDPEVRGAEELVVLHAPHFFEPVVEAGEDR